MYASSKGSDKTAQIPWLLADVISTKISWTISLFLVLKDPCT